jgi:SAM-dependent methyltransferase
VSASAAGQVHAVACDTDRNWEKWARRDPYYAVLSADEFKAENFDPARREQFFDSGIEHIAWVLEIAEQQFGPVARANALDFGCGVGRLIIPLSERFNHATGLDVAPTMIEIARANCSQAGRTNIEFMVSNGLDLPPDLRFEFIHSVLVFQHIAPETGLRIVEQLLERLAPGGVFVLHVNLARHRGIVTNILYQVRRQSGLVHRLLNVARGRPADEPLMEMNPYSTNELLLRSFARGVGGVFAVPFHKEPHPGVLLFLYRKP